MAKRVKSEAQKEYQKERRRLLQAVRRGEQKGFIFPEDVVPPLPSRVTKKQLKQIKETKPSDLYKVASWLDRETGELVSINEAKVSTRTRKIESPKTTIPKAEIDVKTPRVQGRKQRPTLTKEQKHLIAVERGRKAWKTRRAKMSDKEYQEFINQFKQRMQIAIDKKHKNEADYPTISVIDKVKEKVEEMDRVYYQSIDNLQDNITNLKREVPPWFKIENRKGHLMTIFQDTIDYYEDNLSDLEDYLLSQMDSIDTHLDIIRYDSKSEKVENSFVVLGNILNRGALTPSQAESLSEMTEYYEDYEEY